MNENEWSYNKQLVSTERRKNLEKYYGLSTLVERILGEAKNVNLIEEKGNKEARGKWRAKLTLLVEPTTYDILFNSHSGIRGYYYKDIESGVSANESLIRGLKNNLIERATETLSSLTREQAEYSLSANSAKIWIIESQSTLNTKCRDLHELSALKVKRWNDWAKKVVEGWENNEPLPKINDRALLGIQAPEGGILQIVGSWINKDGAPVEFIVPSKVERSKHIHEYGFS